MDFIGIIIFALIGSSIGSFLNVCIDRLPAGKSLAYPPSRCDSCEHPLSPLDLVPVFSFLVLRRRCRYCGSLIPWRVFWVELSTGLSFAFLYWLYGWGVEFLVIAFYFCLFLLIMVVDIKHKLILNKVVYPAAGLVLILDIFFRDPPGPAMGALGAAAGFTLLLLPALIYPGGMGWGDIKMGGLIGLVVGFPLVLVALFMAIVLGALVGGVLLLLKVKKRKEPLPFGPFLSLGAIATLLAGAQILSWYINKFF